jgi:hypothetical protein
MARASIGSRNSTSALAFGCHVPCLRARVEPRAGGGFGGGQLVPPLDQLGEAHGVA